MLAKPNPASGAVALLQAAADLGLEVCFANPGTTVRRSWGDDTSALSHAHERDPPTHCPLPSPFPATKLLL